MAEGPKPDALTRAEIIAEIEALDDNYQTLQRYLLGSDLDTLEAIGALHSFKMGLDRISAHILALYELGGQRTKITWEPLLQNLDTAIQTLQRRRGSDAKTAIRTALEMSEPNVGEVMVYLSKLKASLK